MLTLYRIQKLKEQITHLEEQIQNKQDESIFKKKLNKFIKSFDLDKNDESISQILDIDFLIESTSENSENKQTYYLIKDFDYYLYINSNKDANTKSPEYMRRKILI
jgi:hypothetical protein